MLGARLGGDDDERPVARRVEKRGRARLAGPGTARVQQQDRLAHRHLQAPPCERDQALVDRGKDRHEQPAADACLGQRLHGSVDP